MANNTVATTAPYGTIITAVGKAKITAAILNGTKVNITHAAVGDGGGSYYMPNESQTALINECWRGEVAYYKVNESTPNMIDAKFVIPGEIGGFTVREAALLDKDGDAIAIWNTPDAQKIPITDGVSFPLTMVGHILVEDASAVTIRVNSALDTVSHAEMVEELKKFAAGVGQAIIKKGVTIPLSAWGEAGEHAVGRYKFMAEVADTDAMEIHFPSMALELGSLPIASKAGLSPTIETLDGIVRFWAKRMPSADIVGTLQLRSENMNYSGETGGGCDCPDIATDEEVQDAIEDIMGSGGGYYPPVDPSDPSAPSGLEFATDKEVADMITDIFG